MAQQSISKYFTSSPAPPKPKQPHATHSPVPRVAKRLESVVSGIGRARLREWSQELGGGGKKARTQPTPTTNNTAQNTATSHDNNSSINSSNTVNKSNDNIKPDNPRQLAVVEMEEAASFSYYQNSNRAALEADLSAFNSFAMKPRSSSGNNNSSNNNNDDDDDDVDDNNDNASRSGNKSTARTDTPVRLPTPRRNLILNPRLRTSSPVAGPVSASGQHPQADALGELIVPASSRANKSKDVLTPLESQWKEIKDKNPDVLLAVECGYKYRFFGQDAVVASEVLRIWAHKDHNYMTASVPTHRIHIHLRRLIEAGRKVGVVKQRETAAIKRAGDNKSQLFKRELTAVYSRSNMCFLQDEGVGMESDMPLQSYLMCIMEGRTGSVKVDIGLVCLDVSTGDIIYDSFSDDMSRSNLNTRLLHLQPCEIIMAESTSQQTALLIQRFNTLKGGKCRIETVTEQQLQLSSEATLNNFFEVDGAEEAMDSRSTGMEQESVAWNEFGSRSQRLSPSMITSSLPKLTVTCLGVLLDYLQQFGLQDILKLTSNLTEFSKETTMHLDDVTLTNLDVLTVGNGTPQGSLYGMVNETSTRFGARTLKKWLLQPLTTATAILRRQEAVQELGGSPQWASKLMSRLKSAGDLEQWLCKVYYKKAKMSDVLAFVNSLETLVLESHSIAQQIRSTDGESPQCAMLRDMFRTFPEVGDVLTKVKSTLVPSHAASNEYTLAIAEGKFTAIDECRTSISDVESELTAELRHIRRLVQRPALQYVTVLNNEYMLPIPNTNASTVPPDWTAISRTKAVTRYRTPQVSRLLDELNQRREKLMIECERAWNQLLSEFCGQYGVLRDIIERFACFDCLHALGKVSKRHGYVKPEFEDNPQLLIEGGRHPLVEAQGRIFVPNDTTMASDSRRCIIVTGPNMGGKSCYSRQVATLVLLAQIGSFVPAEKMKLGPFDGIFTRMGGQDSLFEDRSTFLVELKEASNILARATERSLVIMDELGRGTSTHDGTAIAFATLDYVVTQLRCFTLFITHYPLLTELERKYPNLVTNTHMGFVAKESTGGVPVLTFLYKLVQRPADKSYGLNVARLAGVPTEVVKKAHDKSQEMEALATQDRDLRLFSQAVRLTKASKLTKGDILGVQQQLP